MPRKLQPLGYVEVNVPLSLPDDYPLDPYGKPLAMFRDDGRVDLYRARPGESPDGTCALDLIASCTCLESAEAAAFLLSGEAAYPLWLARQPWGKR